MNILLAIELATIIATYIVGHNLKSEVMSEITKNGLKIDEKVMNEYQKRQAQEKGKNKVSDVMFYIFETILLYLVGANLIDAIMLSAIAGITDKIIREDDKIDKKVLNKYQAGKTSEKNDGVLKALLDGTLLIIPGVNIIAAAKKKDYAKKVIMSDPKFKDVLVPIIANNGLTDLFCEELLPLDYTIEEVKKLNDATTYSYKIGKMDGKNVAIIGIPNPNYHVSRVQLKNETETIHPFEEMTDEEAQDKTFVVYPFLDIDENLQRVIEEIKQSRIGSVTRLNLEDPQEQPSFEQESFSIETEESLSQEEQGPRLIKKMYPQNDEK